MRTVCWLPIWLSWLVAVGCGRLSDEPERVTVSGTVTYQGQAVEDGRILFIPLEGTVGPSSGGPVRNGTYSIDHKGGVPVGTHRVKLEAYRKAQAGEFDPLEEDPVVQYLPGKYNSESELTLSVPTGSDPISKDFTLVE